MLALLLMVGTATAYVKMPYLNPAGVTYTSYEAAYGPLAFKSYAGPVAASTYAAPLAAAPFVAAPASAVVPFTRISAQPAVVQKVVDVAHPKVATRRYQIRRPAIQKQFYDIEERIIVRPAGSAVVELEQPISANQRGPTQVSSAVHESQPLIRYAGSHRIHFASNIFPGFAHHVPFAPLPAAPVHEPSVEYEEQHGEQISAQPTPTTPQPFPSTPLPPQQQFPQPLPPQQQFPQPLPPQQEFPQPLPPQQQFPQPQPPQQAFPPQTIPPQQQFPQPLPPQQQFPQPFPPQQQFPQPLPPQGADEPQLDSSDSVAVDNPELTRSGGQQQNEQRINIQEPLFRAQLQRRPTVQQPQPLSRSQNQQQQQQQQPQPQFIGRNLFQQAFPSQIPPLARIEIQQPQEQFLRQIQFQLPQQQFQLPTQLQEIPRPQLLARAGFQELTQSAEERSQRIELTPRPEIPRSQLFARTGIQELTQSAEERSQRIELTPRPEIPRPQLFARTGIQELSQSAEERSQRIELTPRPEVSARQGSTGPTGPTPLPTFHSGIEEIPSVRNFSPEETDLNQRRLIELLTARGPVSEIRSGDEPIRARVISATPAPLNAEPTDFKSNTRRVVVNKPIQTVQEVEVNEPFTKLERVAVHQPAVVKTAHVELAHVPAVHAAVHAAVPAVHAAVPAAVTPVPYAAHYL